MIAREALLALCERDTLGENGKRTNEAERRTFSCHANVPPSALVRRTESPADVALRNARLDLFSPAVRLATPRAKLAVPVPQLAPLAMLALAAERKPALLFGRAARLTGSAPVAQAAALACAAQVRRQVLVGAVRRVPRAPQAAAPRLERSVSESAIDAEATKVGKGRVGCVAVQAARRAALTALTTLAPLRIATEKAVTLRCRG